MIIFFILANIGNQKRQKIIIDGNSSFILLIIRNQKNDISFKCFDELEMPKKSQRESIFLSCVLGIHPSEKLSNYIVIPNSLCPLGKDFVRELKDNSIPFIDIRGINHLDMTKKSTFEILSQFDIQSFFITCPENNDLHLFSNKKINIVSSIVDITGDINIHTNGKIFGPLFGKKETEIEYNWYYECATNKTLTKPNSTNNFVLSADIAKELLKIAKSIRNNSTLPKHINISTPIYTSNEIYEKIQKNYKNIRYSLQPHWKLYKPFLLSIVMTTGYSTKLRIRFQYFIDFLSYYLNDYPDLSFELIVVYTNPEKPFNTVYNISSNVLKYIRLLNVNTQQVDYIKNITQNNYFPEFPIKNIGIRRSRGEYVICINLDTFPQGNRLLDAILYNQFTYLTSFRMARIRVDITNFTDLIHTMNTIHLDQNQFLVSSISKRNWYIRLITYACGDFQGAHYTMINRIYGFIENDCVTHIDSAFQLDLFTQKPPLLMKNMGNVFHLNHNDQLHVSKPFDISLNYIKLINNGVPSYRMNWARENWGSPEFNLQNVYSQNSIVDLK